MEGIGIGIRVASKQSRVFEEKTLNDQWMPGGFAIKMRLHRGTGVINQPPSARRRQMWHDFGERLAKSRLPLGYVTWSQLERANHKCTGRKDADGLKDGVLEQVVSKEGHLDKKLRRGLKCVSWISFKWYVSYNPFLPV